MNTQNYIRKNDIHVYADAVELADGWAIADGKGLATAGTIHCPLGTVFGIASLTDAHKDALAAQLRKQTQANPHIAFEIVVIDSAAYVTMIIYNPNDDEEATPLRFVAHELEEATAFIRAIIDSGVLK
jgi:hypothetical protein